MPIKANAREAGDGGGRARSDPSQPTQTLRTVGAEARLSASREDHHPAPLGCARRHDFSVSAPFVASDRERGRREIGDRNRRSHRSGGPMAMRNVAWRASYQIYNHQYSKARS